MGLFNKKKEVKKEIPLLPELPKFPELPKLDFPPDSFGTEFSSGAIKEAVAGGKEDKLPANEFPDEDEMRMMQEPIRKPLTEEIGEEMLRSKRADFGKERNIVEPVFIRIDWFEEALRIFNETKKKISEIERILEDIKKIKEKEENELKTWENEIRNMKEQIEKVDRDIFSKIK